MTCKFCGTDKPLVKSHIIPRSFYEIRAFKQKAPKKALSLLSDAEAFRPKRRSIGIYDPQLFCKDCEDKFMTYDDYACKLLIERREQRKVLKDQDEVLGEFYDSYDYNKTKLFFMSVLLRAGLSEDPFFEHVKLGPYADTLKESIESGNARSPHDFAVFLAYYAEINRGPVFLPPSPHRMEGVNFYHFHLGRVILYIKVDKRDVPSTLENIIMKPNERLFLMRMDVRSSHAFEVLKRIINNPSNASYFKA